MPTVKLDYKRLPAQVGASGSLNSIPKADFDSFTAARLGLGDIRKEGKYVQAVAAIFDLEGFTTFCNQIDSHLVIPEFLTRFLDWFFKTIRAKFKRQEGDDRVAIWGSLPLFVKFMGDGLLVLWDTSYSGRRVGILNIVFIINEIIDDYTKHFLPDVSRHVSNPPARLRVGVARGQVFSVGDEGDYVGSCINIAARLQKLGGLSFALSRRGFDLSDSDASKPAFWRGLTLKRVELRGIGQDELVWVKGAEFKKLGDEDKQIFRDVPAA